MGEKDRGLKWLFLDLNSYFASVEQQENPSLRGRPVAVVPMMTDSTCAIAASYEAKAFGIRTGTKIYDAKRMCPNLVCVLARHNVYVEYHHRVLAAVDRHLPVHRIWSIDEVDCLLLGRERQPEQARKIAQAIKDQIRKDVGQMIRCSVGIAPNSFLAKVGTEIEKPDGLVILESESLPGPLLSLKLTDLPGINVRMEQRLRLAGIGSVEQLWNTAPRQARALWGGVQGERFWHWLHGNDIPVPETQRCMIGHSRILDPALRPPTKARQMARRLLVKACYRLRRNAFFATALIFSARFTDGGQWERQRTFPAARDPFTFLQHLDILWGEMAADCLSPYRTARYLKKVSVLLMGLRREGEVTEDLFASAPAASAETGRRERLARALDTLQNKYEREMVCVGLVPRTLAGHVGTKIAFSRVPEKEEFWG